MAQPRVTLVLTKSRFSIIVDFIITMIIILSSLFVMGPVITSASTGSTNMGSSSRYGCPQRGLIKPCTCFDKNRGLDISCEGN